MKERKIWNGHIALPFAVEPRLFSFPDVLLLVSVPVMFSLFFFR